MAEGNGTGDPTAGSGAPPTEGDSAASDAKADNIEAGDADASALPGLDAVEARVVGSLVEKSMTTPEYYPMSLNALVNACNQKSNRDPVVAFDEKTVARALESLRDKGLARVVSGGDQRVPRHRHVLDAALALSAGQLAMLAELLLRGPQTVGELRGRARRMHGFDTLDQVQELLEALAAGSPPLVVRLPRQAGRKEGRWAQLLTGAPQVAEPETAAPPPEPATLEVRAENERLTQLEDSVEALRADLAQLRADLESFRRQFE